MIYYLDTSALVKAYVQEARSDEVCDLLHQSRAAPASWLYVSRLTYPETLSAIARRENRGEIAAGDARILQSRLAADFTGPDRLYQIIEPAAPAVNNNLPASRQPDPNGSSYIRAARGRRYTMQ